MLRQMSATEYAEWKAYSVLEPFDGPAQAREANYRAGILASVTYNMWRGKDAAARGPEDFFPSLKVAPAAEPDPEQLTPEQRAKRDAYFRSMAEMLNTAYHGRVEERADVDGR